MDAKIGATKNVAWRFKNEGIRCNAIAPGGKGHGEPLMESFESGFGLTWPTTAISTNIHESYDSEKIDQEGLTAIKLVSQDALAWEKEQSC